MEKTYELIVVLHPDLEIDLEKPLKKVEEIITQNGGKITKQDSWGKRKLAYPIRKLDYGIYVYSEVEIAPTQANKVQSVFNITDEILRYLMVEKDLKAPAATEAAAVVETKEVKED